MGSKSWRGRAVCTAAASLFLAMFCETALAADTEQFPSLTELPSAIRAAKDNFRPLGAEDLEAARAELFATVQRLDEQLNAHPETGDQWREYLDWDALTTQIARNEPDLDVLGDIQKRLDGDRAGLEMAWFLDVRDALKRYRDTARNIGNERLPAAYEKVLEALAQQVEAYTADPSAKGAMAIGYLIDQLRSAGQAQGIVRAVRHHFVGPNLCVRIAADFVAAGLEGPVDRTGPVRDRILGTDVRAQGRTVGRTTVELPPDDRFLVVDTVLYAANDADSIGYNGPARIYSNSTTLLGARKRIWVDADGVHSFPAVSRAKTDNRVRSVCAVRGGRIVAGIASRRVAQQQPLAEAIAADHAEDRLNRQIDEQAEDHVARLDRLYREKFLEPLPKRRLFPERLDYRTTKEALHVALVKADATQIAASSPPPELGTEGQLQLAVHESLVHNVCDQAFAGRTFTKKQYQALAAWVRDEPVDQAAGGRRETWAVGFPQRRPISVEFADGQMTIKIRVARYYEDNESYPGMEATVHYRIEPAGEGTILVRQGEIEIFPPGFDPRGGGRLTPRQVIVRNLLKKRYERIFKPELLVEGFVPGRAWAKIGRLGASVVKLQDRWLAVAWTARPEERAESGTPEE